MSEHKKLYKQKPGNFVDSEAGRFVRTVKLEVKRRAQRNDNYLKHRNVPEPDGNEASSSTSTSTVAKLQRWRVERELKKKIESTKKKPVFKVGIVHHKFYSPIQTIKSDVKPTPCHGKSVRKAKQQPTPPRRVTRATQKRLEAKKAANIQTPGVASTSAVRSSRKRVLSARKKDNYSFAPQNYSFKAPAGLSEIPLFGKFTIPQNAEPDVSDCKNTIIGRSLADSLDSKNSNNLPMKETHIQSSSEDESPEIADKSETEPINTAIKLDHSTISVKNSESQDCEDGIALETPPRSGSPAPASFSPYIVTSRGKNSARKEQRMKMGIRRSSSSEIPTKDTVMQSLNISVEEEEQTAQYFKFIMESTLQNLKEMCNKWEEIKEGVHGDAQYEINQAIGQTNLLIRKKFERFRSLVLDCETGKGQRLVTCKDLQGFWDMVNLEVENCKSRFLELDFLRSKNWIEEQIVLPSKKVTKKKNVVMKPKIAVKSSARSWILAARKKMTQSEASNDIDVVSVENLESKKISRTPLKDGNSRRSSRESLTLDNQDRKLSTPKATPLKTPGSLRKMVQVSQASKTTRSPLILMKVSQMCKTPEITLDSTISYVNSDQTPAKGILKKSESSTSSEPSAPKSTRKVDFNDDVFLDEVAVENDISDQLQNSLDLGKALARIDSYDSEEDNCSTADCDFMESNVTLRKVGKRLDFEYESFIESEYTDTGEAVAAVIPETEIVPEVLEPPAADVIPPIPKVMIVAPTPIRATPEINKTSLNVSDLYEISDQEECLEKTASIRVLRSRTVRASTPNKRDRRSLKSPAVNKLQDFSLKENCDPLGERKDDINADTISVDKEKKNNAEPTKPRRSTRRSIKLSADECKICDSEAVTPHSVRNKKVSVAGEKSLKPVGPEMMEDLISFDSPIKRPTRNRRSSVK